jgi:phosphatidylinositol 4-kinase B
MFLIKANRSLVSFRQNNPNIIYCQGIVLPFHDEELNSNLVVRVIESDCQSFKTKKRVPYRILLETINMQELKGQAPRLTRQVSD